MVTRNIFTTIFKHFPQRNQYFLNSHTQNTSVALKIESVIHISIVEPWNPDLKSSHQPVFTYQYFSHRSYPKPPFIIDPGL